MEILFGILAVLVLVALVQLVRVFELTGKLSGNNQDRIEYRSNKQRARLWLVFGVAYFAFFIWLGVKYGPAMLPEAASEHGGTIDTVINFNWVILIVAFAITHVLLFYFAAKYYWRPNHRADFITHNNKLELVWTTFPAIVLAVIIIYGLSAWNDITGTPPEDGVNIELYSQQFGWTARYAGEDNMLGEANVHFISAMNPLGLITPETISARQEEIKNEIDKIKADLSMAPEGGLKEKELTDKLGRKERQLSRINGYGRKNQVEQYSAGDDDKLVKVEFHVPVNRSVNFNFRSQDVIHSAYMPHFRAQMNCVPGTITEFHFTPTITTAEMRKKTGNADFNYILLCNKICGAAHYNMQMDIIVESEDDYAKWLAEQPRFTSVETAEARTKENGQLAQN